MAEATTIIPTPAHEAAAEKLFWTHAPNEGCSAMIQAIAALIAERDAAREYVESLTRAINRERERCNEDC